MTNMQIIRNYDVVIIGGGPAGIGTAIALSEFGVKNTIVLEKGDVAQSFTSWTKETRLLSPSFTAHQFNLLDLNAITYDTSPGYSYGKEHPRGEDYATYLKDCVTHFKINIDTATEVISIQKEGDILTTQTKNGVTYTSRFVISAIGEFSFPKTDSFPGSELSIHSSAIPSYEELSGDDFVIIGGYESGIDAAINLVKRNKKVTVIDTSSPWETKDSDPSNTLSPYTRERLESVKDRIIFSPNEKVVSISEDTHSFTIITDKKQYSTKSKPINATGFVSAPPLINQLFETDASGFLTITDNDESTITENLFLVGPKVKHGSVLFCFIYKFRMRFGIVAKEIASRLDIATEESVEFYKNKNMYLDDLSCCDTECVC